MASDYEPLEHEADTQPPPTQQNGAPAVTQTTAFFGISAELRNIIYTEVLQHDEALWVTANRRSTVEDGKPPLAEPPALLRVCRLIRSEALNLFYASNTFSITLMKEANVTRAKCWARAIGDSAIKSIFRLRLHGHLRRASNAYSQSNFPVTSRIEVQRKQGGGVDVEDANSQLEGIRFWTSVGPVHQLQRCIRDLAVGREPFSSVGDLEALIETFAKRLEFRQDEVDSENAAISDSADED